MLWLLFFISVAHAQEDLNLKAIQDLEAELPDYRIEKQSKIDKRRGSETRKYDPPVDIVRMPEIETSGTETGHISKGSTLIRLSDNKRFEISRSIDVKYFKLQDEHGYKYLVNNDESCSYKIHHTSVAAIKHELELYEAPTRYTAIPKQIVKKEFDEELSLSPEAFYYLGYVQGDYMKDLFNDERAGRAITNQFGAHLMTEMNLPINPGLSIHYERTNYDLSSGGSVEYSALSFGPRVKTKDFNIQEYLVRFEAEVRMSPWAQAYAKTSSGDVTFDFNSTDLFLAAEHPIKNSWGEFRVGAFFQNQWLNIKNQTEIVKLDSSNNTNKSLGISLGQVF